ncbi:helicase-related protein [Thermococcus waiotapuensis]|uniref:Helicase-related protein n=1 Tax=Thermococcus waiotapuensis TaxID=90909 RepID=A0AAE4NW56_9EURY|nr:helicase-related protein [Thermococcus waiotapuensis]MDV3104680.1 helicase-related protein [Thermococcus waiotapuensis]
MSEKVPEGILRDVLLHSPALFYTTLTAPGRKPITPFRHQFQPLYHAMITRPVRMLIADEIGLGKTVQALAIARYLQLRGEAKKILVLVPKILREQWEQEIRRVGDFPTVIENGHEVESKLRNADGYVVVSIDLAKRYPHNEKFLNVPWDLVIVDEVHNSTLGTQRYEFLRALVGKKKDFNVVFLSATPHRGNPVDYLARIALLDPTIMDQFRNLDRPDFYKKTRDTLVLRRTKKVVNELEGREVFKKCHFGAVVVEVSGAEREFLGRLDEVLFEMTKNAGKNSPRALLAVLVKKRASSSYEAAMKTIRKIVDSVGSGGGGNAEKIDEYIKSLFGLGYDEIELEDFNDLDDVVEKIIESYSPLLDRKQVESFKELLELAKQIGENDSKLEMVARIVSHHLGRGEKVIIFTEFKDTLEYVRRKLPRILAEKYNVALGNEDISVLYGGMSSGEVEEQMKKFERHGKLLVSTDVASEGLNLQVASVVINYEAPWSPIKLEQRVGRIWRLSQPRETTAYTLFLATEADLYVLENLYRKIMNITEAIGSAQHIGKPVFGKKMFSGDFEAIWKEDAAEEGTPGEEPSEYDLVLASIKREMTGYVGAIVRTLRNLRQNIEKMVPSDTARQVREELERILARRDFDGEEVSRVLRVYITEVLGRKNVPEILPVLHDIVGGGPSELEPVRIGVRGMSGIEYLYLVRLVDKESGKEVHRYPVLIKGENFELFYGVELLEHLTEVFSRGFVVIGRPEPTMEERVASSKVETFARDRLYSLRTKYRDYENSRGRLKGEGLFRSTVVQVTEVLRIEGISEERFNILKYIPGVILDVYGFSEEDVEAPTDEYRHITERNFVPLEDILESERRAMEVVLELERKRLERKYGSGGDWKVEDVSLKEHYDVRVVEPEGEKFIEVKGHKSLLLTAEVTSAEYEFAKSHRDRYWIYIVANLGKNRPVILKVFHPFERDAKVYAVLEDGEEVEITGKVSVGVRDRVRKVLSVG